MIRSTRSLVSVGTERMLVEFGQAGLVEKVRQQPDKVKMVLQKMATDGISPTIEAVFSKLDQPLPMGYCNVGIVMDTGAGVTGFAAGDRVVSNGHHSEVVSVPANLCAKVVGELSDDEAAFTVIGAIALQGIRLVNPTLGEAVVVTGLGLVGLVTVQLLRAHGCRVLGIDYDPAKTEMARRFGAETVDLSAGEDPLAAARVFSRGRGMDAVIITAATKSNEPVHQAALMCRKRGRIVLVGVAGLELSRADFYEKELTFQVSCSYGPGRYDADYEEKGFDYPVGFVRWTEQRNFEAVLDMMADGRLNVKPLISHRFKVEEASKAYDVVAGSEPSLGILIEYPSPAETPNEVLQRRTIELNGTKPVAGAGQPSVAFVGSGSYASSVLMPAFKAAGASLATVVSSKGITGFQAGRRFGFRRTSTDTASVLSDASVDAIVIGTRHDSHARLTLDGLRAGKHVFVEKPLALTIPELDEITSAWSGRDGQILTVGFNRRFAPHVLKMKELLAGVREPKAFIMTVNAGELPGTHWSQDKTAGGGRIIGEGCHFVDLLRFLAQSPISSWTATSMSPEAFGGIGDDKATITLNFADGSMGTIHYLANGSKAFPKERLEVFGGGRILQLDNFRTLRGFGWSGFSKMKLMRQDKGQKNCVAAFVRAVAAGAPPPIPRDELLEVSRVTIEVGESLR